MTSWGSLIGNACPQRKSLLDARRYFSVRLTSLVACFVKQKRRAVQRVEASTLD
jgi:hypothetical protein